MVAIAEDSNIPLMNFKTAKPAFRRLCVTSALGHIGIAPFGKFPAYIAEPQGTV